MKRILFAAFLFVLVGCQAKPSIVEPTQEISGGATIEAAAPSPEPEIEPTEPSPTSEPASDIHQIDLQERFDASGILEKVVWELAARLGVDRNDVQVLSIQQVDWPDAGLGCPFPGMEYAQVITPGYLITLAVEGRTYTYHTDTLLKIVLCSDKGPALPLIPVEDGIMDGIPWMPVDPIPTVSKGEINIDPDPVK